MIALRRVLLALVVLGTALPAFAQTIDCDAPAPTTPGIVTSGRPYTVAFCLPSTVTDASGTVPVRVDGYIGQLDTNAPTELGKLALGTPSPTQKLSPVSFQAPSGIAKGNHTWTITPWNCPLDPVSGVPMPTCTAAQQQKASPVAIPFVANDPVMTGAPPSIQKGRVSK
jgi:hypothetical protein